MNMTLHVTDACNMACKYCFQTRSPHNMTYETARKAVDLSVMGSTEALDNGAYSLKSADSLTGPDSLSGAESRLDSRISSSTGICFFGGEPLLLRELIINTVNYCNSIKEKRSHRFIYKLVTNGLLLDEEFLSFADRNNIGIALSHDGLMQDDSRILPDGSGSSELLDAKIQLLLSHQPDAIVMCTVNPVSAGKFADSVEWLFKKGFRRIYTTPAVGNKVCWTDEKLTELDVQYRKIVQLYINWTAQGERFIFPAFDTKMEMHILGEQYRHKTCRFGQKQVSIAPDGSIYPCVQFVGEPMYLMGNVFSGISDMQQKYVIEQGRKEPGTCRTCALRGRCKYNCCCRNKQMTGETDQVSPFTCCHEKLLIRYADEAANALFEQHDNNFIKKQYENRLKAAAWESL